MPEAQIKKRGGAKRWRTIHPKGHPEEYIHVAVVRRKGKKGGTTVAGPIRQKMHA